MENTSNHTESNIIKLEQPIGSLASSLAKAQGQMTGAKKDKKNPFFKSTYADLESVFNAIRDPLAKNGLAISQTMDILPNGTQVLCTMLMHVSGERIESKMLLPTEINPQKLGSCITYFRRYMLMAICGVPSEDDDGEQAAGKAKPRAEYITHAQVAALEKLINGHNEVRESFMANCKGNMGSLTVDRYPGAVAWIKELINAETKATK